MTNQNAILPAIALRGTTILPGMIVHFDVSRERSKKAIEAAMLHDQKIFLVTQIDPEVENPDVSGVYRVGTIGYIKQVVKLPQDILRVLVEGTGRAVLEDFSAGFPLSHRCDITCERGGDPGTVYSDRGTVPKSERTVSQILHGKWKNQQRAGFTDPEY